MQLKLVNGSGALQVSEAAFGTKFNEALVQQVNRKMYRGAIRSMLSELARTERLLVTDGIQLAAPKTRLLAQQLKAWELPSVLIVVEANDEKLILAARNLPHVEVIEVPALNPVSLAAYDKVLMTVGAVKLIEERLQ